MKDRGVVKVIFGQFLTAHGFSQFCFANRHYEETKHMTVEEKWAYDQKGIDEFKMLMEEVNPDDYDFSWLRRK